MSTDRPYLGSDLRLLDDLRRQDQRDRGADLRTIDRSGPARTDLDTVGGTDTLAQALLLRLLTFEGELAALGHPTYGSRLHELIGEPNTAANRDRVRLYTLRALLTEPRVAEVTSLTVTTRRREPTRVDVTAVLTVITEPNPAAEIFGFGFDFDGGVL